LTTDPADERRYKREELKAETFPFPLFPPVKPIESLLVSAFSFSVLQLFLHPHPCPSVKSVVKLRGFGSDYQSFLPQIPQMNADTKEKN
jgi:hypothetical protein